MTIHQTFSLQQSSPWFCNNNQFKIKFSKSSLTIQIKILNTNLTHDCTRYYTIRVLWERTVVFNLKGVKH